MALRPTTNPQDYGNTIADISVDVISIMESSLRVVLISHVTKLRKSKDIIGAAALFLSLLIVLITAEFKSEVFDANTWYGIFIVFTIAAAGYLGYVIFNHCQNKDSVDAIIEDIKAARGGALTGMRVPTGLAQFQQQVERPKPPTQSPKSVLPKKKKKKKK